MIPLLPPHPVAPCPLSRLLARLEYVEIRSRDSQLLSFPGGEVRHTGDKRESSKVKEIIRSTFPTPEIPVGAPDSPLFSCGILAQPRGLLYASNLSLT